MNDEFQLWENFRYGDEKAFKVIFERYNRFLYNYGYKFAHDENLVEDSVQELFVKLWYNRETIGETASVKNYLFKSLRRIIVRKLERNNRFFSLKDVEGDNLPFNIELAHDVAVIHKERLQEIRSQLEQALSKMSPRQREIIHLRYFEELSYEEISEIMGISVKHTYKLMYRSMDSLRVHLSSFNFIAILALLPYFRQS